MKILRRRWKFGLIIVFCFCIYSCFSAKEKPESETADIGKLKPIGKAESRLHRTLISNNIRSISADQSSVWVATLRGVSKLDRSSNKWVHYTQDDGLGSDAVHVVVSEGRWVWFGTDNGVTLYDVNLQSWRTFEEKDGLRGGMVKSIAIEGNYVWVGTEGGGLNRYDRNTDSWASRTQKDGLSNNGVNAIAIDSKYIWVGTHHGVNRYDRITDSWNRYFKKDGLVQNSVWTIGIADNFVWFGSPWNGISVYDVINQAFMRTYTKTDLLSSNDIRAIVIDGNNIWIGTANSGVQRYIEAVNAWVQYTEDDGLASNHITCITVHKNEIWFGTYDNGVSMYDKVRNRWTTYVEAESPPEDDVKEIARDDGKLWLATSGGLLNYHLENKEWTRYGKKDGLPTNFVTTVKTDEKNVWLGTSRGLACLVGAGLEPAPTWQFYNNADGLSEEFITSLAITSDEGKKILWVGTNRGLFYLSLDGKSHFKAIPETPLVQGFNPRTTGVTALAEDGNSIWIGTASGVFQYNQKSGLRSHVIASAPRRGLSRASGRDKLRHPENRGEAKQSKAIPAYVNSILVLGNQVWFGTRGGIHIYEKATDTWRKLSVEDGLPAYNVRTLKRSFASPLRSETASHLSGNTVWIGTSAGLAKYDFDTPSATQSKDIENGKLEVISGSTAYGIKSIIAVTDDTLWLGTTTGVVEYNISTNNYREQRAFVTRHPFVEDSIANIEFDGDTLWFSNWSKSHNGAISRYNRRNNTWQRFTRETIFGDTKAKSPTRIKRICVDDKWVWFATDYGVLQYDKREDSWRHFTTKDGLLSNNIRIIASCTNVVWVCPEFKTRINKYDKKTGEWSQMKLSRLIYPRNYIYDMKADGDVLWLSISSSGVRKISENCEETVYMKELGAKRGGKAVFHGLAQTGARWIEVDKDYVWVAHWKGRGSGALSVYNKKTGEWTIYSKEDVLEEDFISKIVVEKKYVWILYEAWQKGSVTGYDRQTGEWITIKPKENWGSEVKEICEDGAYLWLATERNGLKRLHLASGTWTQFDGHSGLLMTYINDRALKVDEKYVWVGTPKGISRYDKNTELWTSFTKQATLQGKRIRAVATDSRYVWCGTAEGVSRYDKIYGRWSRLHKPWGSVENVSALAVDDRYLWIGTRIGAHRYDKITDKWDSFRRWNGLPSEDISAVVVDGYDVWMGTNGGICKFPRISDNLNAWESYTSGLELTSEAMEKEYAATLVSNEVWCMDADKDNIWIGTMRGASRYDKKKDIWTTHTAEEMSLLANGGEGGGGRSNLSEAKSRNAGLPNNEISSVCIDGDIVWLGNNSGVTTYDKKSKKWKTYTVDDGLSSNRITCIAKRAADSQTSQIWFGTFDAGVMKFDKNTRRWQTYSRKDGLAHNSVYSIAVDGDFDTASPTQSKDLLWIGTQQGLSRYDCRTSSFTTYTEYGDSEDISEMVVSVKIEGQRGKRARGLERKKARGLEGTEVDAYLGPVIGNKRSKKYHHPESPSAEQIKKENRLHFNSVAEAEAAGYERAGNFK